MKNANFVSVKNEILKKFGLFTSFNCIYLKYNHQKLPF